MKFEKKGKEGKNHFDPAGDRSSNLCLSQWHWITKNFSLNIPTVWQKVWAVPSPFIGTNGRSTNCYKLKNSMFFYNTIDKLEPNILCMYIVQLIHEITISIWVQSYFNIVMLRQNTDPIAKICKRTSSYLRTVQGPYFIFSANSLSQKCAVDL